MIMYKTLFFIIFSVFVSISFAGTESKIFHVPDGTNLYGCDFISSTVGCVAGESGVWRTTDAGKTWTKTRGIQGFALDVKFANDQIGYALVGGWIYKSTNAGRSWSVSLQTGQNYLFNIAVNEDHAYVIGPSSIFIATTDQGQTWSVNQSAPNVDMSSIFIHEGRICVTALNGNWQNQTDGFWSKPLDSETWTNHGLNRWSNNAAVIESRIFVSGDNNRINTTSDFGSTWQEQNIAEGNWFYSFKDIKFVNQVTGYVIGMGNNTVDSVVGVIFRTEDSGVTWSKVHVTSTAFAGFRKLAITDAYTYAVGYGGTVIRFGNSPIGIENQNGETPTDFQLHQNYPNPFNPETKINFSIPKKSNVSIMVYDISGKEIQRLIDSEVDAGQHSVSFIGSNLSSGVYFYKLTVGDFTATKKMIVIK